MHVVRRSSARLFRVSLKTKLLEVSKRHVLDVFLEMFDISQTTVLWHVPFWRIWRRIDSEWTLIKPFNRQWLHYKKIPADPFSNTFIWFEDLWLFIFLRLTDTLLLGSLLLLNFIILSYTCVYNNVLHHVFLIRHHSELKFQSFANCMIILFGAGPVTQLVRKEVLLHLRLMGVNLHTNFDWDTR